jgi:hypothetical protein
MSEVKDQVSFSVNARPTRATRYTLTNTRETAEGGRVGVGVDTKGNAYLVHEIGRATEAVALHAVATAIAAGSIPVDAVVGAFKECDSVDALGKAAMKAGFQPPAPKSTPSK